MSLSDAQLEFALRVLAAALPLYEVQHRLELAALSQLRKTPIPPQQEQPMPAGTKLLGLCSKGTAI